MNDKSIFVTGGTGLLGSYLLRYLVRNGATRIMALKRSGSPMELVSEVQNAVEWVEGDLLEIRLLEEVLDSVEQVYHCAGLVSFQHRHRRELFRINAEGTANLVNLCLDTGIEKFVHVSSIAALGRTKRGTTINEAFKWRRSNLNSDYAVSKFLAEQEVWRGMVEGLNVAIANPSVMLGSGYWNRNTCRLWPRMAKGLRLYPPGTTGYVDVRDVARFLIQLMGTNCCGERFIVNSENLSYRTFFTELAQSLNQKPPVIQVSPWLAQLARRAEQVKSLFTGQAPLITRSTAQVTAHHFYYDNTKSRAVCDFSYIPIRQTIQEISTQYLEAKKAGKSWSVLPLK